MNWRAGLLRLWLVATAIWIVAVVWREWCLGPGCTFLPDDPYLAFEWISNNQPDLLGWLFIPPIAILAVGASLVWAFRGFGVR